MFQGMVKTSTGLYIARLIVGFAGGSFVTCVYWTSSMFTKEVAGTANAIAAGWGNLGGGAAQLIMGTILVPFLQWIYSIWGRCVELLMIFVYYAVHLISS